jgi:hypothetical protein
MGLSKSLITGALVTQQKSFKPSTKGGNNVSREHAKITAASDHRQIQVRLDKTNLC